MSEPTGGYARGHHIAFDGEAYRYDDGSVYRGPVDDRPCLQCGREATPEGYDACLGHIEGARAACCGHGVQEGYVLWP